MIARLFILTLILIPNLIHGQSTEKDAYALGVEGIQKVDAGEYELGIKLLKKARNLEPQEYDYTLEIGKAYLKSGNPKKAERFLYDLQYHVNVQPDLYLLLTKCYAELDRIKTTQDPQRKKEVKTLQYGIQKLPSAGILYLKLGEIHLELEQPVNALAVWEKGIQNAPNFSENYYWASRMLDISGSKLWAWIYGETFLNMSEESNLKRSIAPAVFKNAQQILSDNWKADPDKLDQQLKIVQAEFCNTVLKTDNFIADQVAARNCLLENWKEMPANVAPLFKRMEIINERGWAEAYVTSMFQEVERESFLNWLASNANVYDQYAKWSYWNKLTLTAPIIRYQ